MRKDNYFHRNGVWCRLEIIMYRNSYVLKHLLLRRDAQ